MAEAEASLGTPEQEAQQASSSPMYRPLYLWGALTLEQLPQGRPRGLALVHISAVSDIPQLDDKEEADVLSKGDEADALLQQLLEMDDTPAIFVSKVVDTTAEVPATYSEALNLVIGLDDPKFWPMLVAKLFLEDV